MNSVLQEAAPNPCRSSPRFRAVDKSHRSPPSGLIGSGGEIRKMGKFQFWTLKWTLIASCLISDAVVGAQTIPLPRRWAATSPATSTVADSKVRPVQADQPKVGDDSKDTMKTPASPPTLLDPNTRPIDLNTALRLAGVQNPQLMIARQRVVEAAALRQLAAAQFLPSINIGTNYDGHTGPLQQSNGNILSVNRSALYVGAGAGAIAASTINIPGVVLEGNVAVMVFGYLTAPGGPEREFATLAIRNQTFLKTTLAYSELLRAEGRAPWHCKSAMKQSGSPT